MPKKTKTDSISEEKNSQVLSEAGTSHLSEPTQEEVAVAPDEEAQKAVEVEEATDTDSAIPAEVAAIHVIEEKPKTTKEKVVKKETKKAVKTTKTEKSKRSKNYLELRSKVEKGKLYLLAEALELVKELSSSKFDGSVEVHMRLNKKKAKGSTESSRGTVNLPHGTGKERKVIILDEKKIDEIFKTKKIDFDVAIASPDLMPKVAKIAKILGPKGKMPDPKSGTVTNDPQRVIEEIKSGKTEYRIDSNGIIHQMIGKVSWTSEKLTDNAKIIFSIYPKSRIATIFLTASIGPSIPIDTNKL